MRGFTNLPSLKGIVGVARRGWEKNLQVMTTGEIRGARRHT